MRSPAEAVPGDGLARAPLVFVEEAHDLPVVLVQASLRSGSAWDPPGREGLARMTVEMLRRGAGGRSRAEIDETLDRLGADIGASAGADSISLTGHVLKRNLEPFLAVFSDVLCAPDFPENEVEKLRREMLAALDEMREDDHDLCSRHFARHLYGDHPYGRSSLGTEASIAAITNGEIRDFYLTHFADANMIIGLSGDVDDATAAAAKRAVARLGHRPAPPAIPLVDPPVPAGRRLLLVDKPERTQTQLLIGHPAPRWGTPEYDALQVATTAFGGTFTGRLMTEVRVKRGLSYGAYATLHGGRGRGHLDLWVFPSAKDTIETLALVLGMYDDLASRGLAEDEIAFARRHLVGHFPLAIETPERRLSYRTDLEICGLPADYLSRYRDRISSVTPAAVADAVQRYVTPRHLAVTLVATAAAVAPEIEEARERLALDEVRAVKYDSY